MKTALVILLCTALALGCGQSNEPEPYRIGWIGALTGSATQWGEPALHAATLAAEEINSEGGVNGRPLQLIIEDSQSSGTATATAARKLIDESGVHILLTHSSTESLAAAPIAESARVILFASATSTPDLTNAGDYTFRVTPVNREGELLAVTLNEKNIRRTAILTEQAPYTLPIREAFLENYDGEILVDEQFQPGSLDSRTTLAKIKSKDIDAIVLLPFGIGPMLEILKTLEEQNLSAQVFGNAAFETPEVGALLKNTSLRIEYSTLFIDENDPEVQAFTTAYEARYGPIPNKAHTIDAATKIYLIADALEECGEDAECIKQFLYNIKEQKTLSGVLTIDENGDADKRFVMKRAR